MHKQNDSVNQKHICNANTGYASSLCLALIIICDEPNLALKSPPRLRLVQIAHAEHVIDL